MECQRYHSAGGTAFIDTPGIQVAGDADTTRRALATLAAHDRVVVVAKATHLDEDLADLLPLVEGKRAVVVATFWDKVGPAAAANRQHLWAWRARSPATPLVAVDARSMADADRREVMDALDRAAPAERVDRPPAPWRVLPRRRLPLAWPVVGPALALVLMVLPLYLAVYGANAFAGHVDPFVGSAVQPWAKHAAAWRWPLPDLLAGPYGLLTMFPLMFVWALPTVVTFAVLLGAYKASGLLDRLAAAIHPVLRPFGLTGRDLTRVLMGFGCNVPAVLSTRSCSSCTRGTTIGAIAFGSACSYQLGATLAVFAAAGRPWLVWPYVGYLAATTLLYARLTHPASARPKLRLLVLEDRGFLTWPGMAAVWRAARSSVVGFLRNAMPIFLAITLVAPAAAATGVMDRVAAGAAPLMAAFGLPRRTALAIVRASVRKDGLLLLPSPGGAPLTAVQLLTATHLGSVLLPCLVTTWTVRRETGAAATARMLGRQVVAAVSFTAVLACDPTGEGRRPVPCPRVMVQRRPATRGQRPSAWPGRFGGPRRRVRRLQQSVQIGARDQRCRARGDEAVGRPVSGEDGDRMVVDSGSVRGPLHPKRVDRGRQAEDREGQVAADEDEVTDPPRTTFTDGRPPERPPAAGRMDQQGRPWEAWTREEGKRHVNATVDVEPVAAAGRRITVMQSDQRRHDVSRRIGRCAGRVERRRQVRGRRLGSGTVQGDGSRTSGRQAQARSNPDRGGSRPVPLAVASAGEPPPVRLHLGVRPNLPREPIPQRLRASIAAPRPSDDELERLVRVSLSGFKLVKHAEPRGQSVYAK